SGGHTRSDTQRRAAPVYSRQNAVFIGRTGVADPGTRRGHRTRGNPTTVERRQPRDPGLVNADPGVIEKRSERLDLERETGSAVQYRTMRVRLNNCPDGL